MFLNSLNADIDRITVTLIDDMSTERYNLSFYDIDDKLIKTVNDVSLEYIEEHYSSFIKYRVDELHLYYGQTKNINNLYFDRDIDFCNFNVLNSLIKQLFICCNNMNIRKQYIILYDGTLISVSDDIENICTSIINRNNVELSFMNCLDNKIIYINKNTIFFSGIPTEAQKDTLGIWMTRFLNSKSIDFNFYKDNKIYHTDLLNIHKQQELYAIVNNVYSNNSTIDETYLNELSLNSCLKNLYPLYRYVDRKQSYNPDILIESIKLETLDKTIKYKKKVIYKDIDDILDKLLKIIVDGFNQCVDENIPIGSVAEISTGYAYHYEFDKTAKKFKATCDLLKNHIIKDSLNKQHIECSWHPIVLYYKHNGNNSTMSTGRELPNIKRKLTNKEFVLYSTDKVIITINLDNLKTVGDIKQKFQHEFTHVIDSWGKVSFSKLNTTKGKFANINTSIFPRLSDAYKQHIWMMCYTFEENENTAIINELRRYIINNIGKGTVNANDFDTLSDYVYNNSREEIVTLPNMEYVINEITNLDFNNKSDIIKLLIYAYYLTKHRIINIHCQYTTENFINKLINDSIDNIKYKELCRIQKKIMNYVTFIYEEFKADYKETIRDVLVEIRNN